MKLLIISIPSISALTILTIGRYIGIKGGEYISKSSIILSMILSFISLKEYIKGLIINIDIKEWFKIGEIDIKVELIYDKESIIMINLISIITVIIIYYSYWYLKEDPHINRFISYILIFSVTMYILVLSKNLFLTFFGWEGVGIMSFLLINYWSNSIENSKSAIKAIIFNKIGDIFYLFAMMIIGIYINNYDFNLINNYTILQPFKEHISIFLNISLILAAMAKSAQILLHCWLGDAMAGPTPVSALLHAATMVTAGIYFLLKLKLLFYSNLHILILLIGSLTILFAGLASLNQFDIKKIIAYSTCSQIGYMFFAISLFFPYNISLFHLITHGFFKALLFLTAGLLIHSFLNEQDLRKFGLFIFTSPLFYIFFFIGSFAIMAVPPFSGFFSKDLILLHSLQYSYFYYLLLSLGSLFSSLYSIKILYYSFFNNSPSFFSFIPISNLNLYSFLFPFFFLLFGSIFLGYFSSSFFSSPEYLNIYLESSLFSTSSFFFKFITLFIPLFSLIIFFLKKSSLITSFSSFYYIFIISSRKFFFDNFFNYLIITPVYSISYHFFFKFIDRGFLEFIGPLSLFRLFFFFPSSFGLFSQSSTNTPYLYFYFFISLFALFLPFLFLI